MTMARSQLVNVSVTRWYHCVTRCVRRAFLLGEGASDRKAWIEKRIEEPAEIFAVAVGGFSVMDYHLHLLLRLDPEVAQAWSDEDVVRRWGRLFPRRWQARLEKLRIGRLFGRFFAASRQKLREAAARLNVRSVANLAGCPVR